MLVDHRIRAERDAQERNQQSRARCAYGDFIARLAPWNWFPTITFRDTPSIIGRESGPPSADRALRQVNIFLQTIQRHAPGAGWVLVQESGSYGRLHFHFLLTGVGILISKRGNTKPMFCSGMPFFWNTTRTALRIISRKS